MSFCMVDLSTKLFALATACEVLARRIVHRSPHDRLNVIMSTRFRHRQLDGDLSDMSSALELAIDSQWWAQSLQYSSAACDTCVYSTIFLSSSEAQDGKHSLAL